MADEKNDPGRDYGYRAPKPPPMPPPAREGGDEYRGYRPPPTPSKPPENKT